MSLLYFHLRDGQDTVLDPDGRRLDSASAIAEAALLEARAIVSADALGGAIKLDQRIDVVDRAGAIVHSLPFADAVEISPPVDPANRSRRG